MAEQKQDKPKIPNDYELLGLEETATLQEVRSAYKKLALIWAPDRYRSSKLYPPDEKQKSLEEVQQEYVLIKQAHINLVEKLSSPPQEQKSTRKEKQSLPRNEAEFIEFLKEKDKNYTSFIYTQLQAASLEVKQNIWKLIKAKRLSYNDLDTMGEADTEFLWVVYKNSELVDFINNHIPKNEKDNSIVTLMQLKDDYLKARENRDKDFYRYLEETWEEATGKRLAEHEVSFLLYILSRPEKRGRFSSHLHELQMGSSIVANNLDLMNDFADPQTQYLGSSVLPVAKMGTKWLIDFSLDYLSGQKNISLSDFRKQAIFGTHIFFTFYLTDSSNEFGELFREAYFEEGRLRDLTTPEAESIEHLMKEHKTEEEARKKRLEMIQEADRLKIVYKLIPEIISYELLNWLREYEKDPDAFMKLMAKDIPMHALVEKLNPIFQSKSFEEFEAWLAQLKRTTSEPMPIKKPAPPQVGTLESMHNYFLKHPIKTSTSSLTLITVLVCGGIALEKYLQNENVYQWLRQDVGMKTTADLSVIMAGIILILFIAAVIYAKKAASNAQKISPTVYEAKEAPASESICSIV